MAKEQYTRQMTMSATRRLYSLLLLGSLASHLIPAYSQGLWSVNKKQSAIAFSASHHAYDPAFGVEFTSRGIVNNQFSLRFRANIQLSEAYKASTDTWACYHSFSLGLVYKIEITTRTRFYAELGAFVLAPDNRFTAKKLPEGFYELNGLEIFFFSKTPGRLAVYFAAGPAFTNARAEKLEGSPHYGNGLLYVNGLRFYF